MSGITSIKSLIKPLGYDNGGEVKNQRTKILAEPLVKPTDIDPLYDETGGSRLDVGKTKFSGGLPTPPIVDKIARGIFNALNPFKKAKLAMNIASNKPFSTNLMSNLGEEAIESSEKFLKATKSNTALNRALKEIGEDKISQMTTADLLKLLEKDYKIKVGSTAISKKNITKPAYGAGSGNQFDQVRQAFESIDNPEQYSVKD